jgi:hypothetical protein
VSPLVENEVHESEGESFADWIYEEEENEESNAEEVYPDDYYHNPPVAIENLAIEVLLDEITTQIRKLFGEESGEDQPSTTALEQMVVITDLCRPIECQLPWWIIGLMFHITKRSVQYHYVRAMSIEQELPGKPPALQPREIEYCRQLSTTVSTDTN